MNESSELFPNQSSPNQSSSNQSSPKQQAQTDNTHNTHNPHNTDTLDDGEYVSRTAIKKEVQAITALGISLTELSDAELNQIELSDTLKKAVCDARAIKSFGAKKRQIQYLGKLLRNEDHEAVEAGLKHLQDKHKQSVHLAHQCEQWRDRLITEGKSALSDFIAQFPEQDIQQLRQLIRQAQKEQKENKPPASARKLFRWIRALMAAAS